MQWQDFDLDGKVRVPVGFYLLLAYLCRGYLMWVISLTYSDDRSLLLSLVYADGHTFFLNLVLGLPALFCFALFALKTQRQKPWFKFLWNKQKFILLMAVLADLSAQLLSIRKNIVSVHWVQITLFLLGFYLIWYWVRSAKIKRFFDNWLMV